MSHIMVCRFRENGCPKYFFVGEPVLIERGHLRASQPSGTNFQHYESQPCSQSSSDLKAFPAHIEQKKFNAQLG